MMWPHERPEARFTSHRLLLDKILLLFCVNFLVQSGNNLYKLQELHVESLMLSLLFYGQMPTLEIKNGFGLVIWH